MCASGLVASDYTLTLSTYIRINVVQYFVVLGIQLFY